MIPLRNELLKKMFLKLPRLQARCGLWLSGMTVLFSCVKKQAGQVNEAPTVARYFDSAVEIETFLSPDILNLLTSKKTDLKSFDLECPENNRTKVLLLLKNQSNLGKLRWQDLSTIEKKDLISTCTRGTGDSFFHEQNGRKVPGLKFDDLKKTQVVNEFYYGNFSLKQGEFLNEISRFIPPLGLEFVGTSDREQWRGVEIHFRKRNEALLGGDQFAGALELSKALRLRPLTSHTHMVVESELAQLNYQALVEGSQLPLGSFKLLEYLRRVNLYSDMYSVLIDKAHLKSIQCGQSICFDILRSHYLFRLENYLGIPETKRTKINGRALGNVSFQFPGKYDRPNAWGFEFRNFSPDTNRLALKRQILNKIHSDLSQDSLPIDPDKFRRYFEESSIGGAQAKFSSKQSVLLPEVPKYENPLWLKLKMTEFRAKTPAVQAELTESWKIMIESVENTGFWKKAAEHLELGLVLKDWINDPAFSLNDEQRERYAQSKILALRQFVEGKEPLQITTEFLKANEFATLLAQSLKLPDLNQ